MSAKADNVIEHPQTVELTEVKKDSRRKKRMRERGSQMDEEGVDEELNHGCSMCSKELDRIQEKLDKVLALIPEMQKLQAKVTELEKEKNDLKDSLEWSQAEIAELKIDTVSTMTKLAATGNKFARVEALEERLIKQECHNLRNNIKFFGIQDDDHESPKDTESKLRQFLHKEMKIPSSDLKEIHFERVHRIPTRPKEYKKNLQRPIIAKVAFFQDKEFIKSHIKKLPKGKKLGVSDDFPK